MPGEGEGYGRLTAFSRQLPSPEVLQSWVLSAKMKDETPRMPPSCPWCLPENNRRDSLNPEPNGFYPCVQKLN